MSTTRQYASASSSTWEPSYRGYGWQGGSSWASRPEAPAGGSASDSLRARLSPPATPPRATTPVGMSAEQAAHIQELNDRIYAAQSEIRRTEAEEAEAALQRFRR